MAIKRKKPKENIRRPAVAEIDPEFVGLIMAHHARRLTARNVLVAYGTNMGQPPGFGIGSTSDLMELHAELLFLEDAMKTSEDLFELISLKRIQAQGFIDRVREEELPEEVAEELVKHAVLLNREIGRLTDIMEAMSGA